MQSNEEGRRRTTIGVLKGTQVYYGTILGNFIGPVLEGVRSAAQDYGCNLLLACGMEHFDILARPAWPVPSPDVDFVPVGPWNTDGLIVINPLLSDTRSNYIRDLKATGFPVVFISTGEEGPMVAIDNMEGIYQAVTHLVKHGHHRIAFIAGYPQDTSGDSGIRLNAYQAAIQKYGLVVDPNLIAYGYHNIQNGAKAMQQILKSGVPFTAVLASNDESAVGAIQVLKEAGRRIPQDVAIVGFDDNLVALTHVPSLTTLHFSPTQMGYQALELLLEYILGRKKDVKVIKISPQLVIRQSCGCELGVIPTLDLGTSERSTSYEDRTTVMSQLVQAMTKGVMAEARCLGLEEVHALCSHLVEAFVSSLKYGEATALYQVLNKILSHTEEIGDDAHVWHAAISILESRIALLMGTGRLFMRRQQANEMLRQTRGAINESVRRQFRNHMADQQWMNYNRGLLNYSLLAALDEAQIYEILAEHLPGLRIQHVGVAFFEPGEEDMLAWSVLHAVPPRGEMNLRFPTRQFPPKGLYDEPFSLALLPLANMGEKRGFVAFDAANLETYAIIIWQLVTFFKVVQLYQEATEGRRLAEEANRLKSRLLSMVSHELRTPLNLIVALSEDLLREKVEETEILQQDMKTIHASAKHLDGLIRDVLDLAQNEVGQLKLVYEPLDLAEVLQPVAEVGEQLARDNGLAWQVDIPTNMPEIYGDRTRLRQVVMNLVNNAVNFTKEGQIKLQASVTGGTITVMVSDTGLGIPLDEQEAIFDEFHQSIRTTARGYGGLGLGLAICKRLVELHNGEIGLYSSGEEGAGSTFYFTIPLIKNSALVEKEDAVSFTNKVLLGVKHSGSEKPLGEYLTRQGFDVNVLEAGQSDNWSLPLLVSPPGAVIMDKGIADEQGWELLKLLRGNPSTKDVPILFYNLEQNKDKGSILELDYLTKPISLAELTQALERQGLSSQDQQEKTVLVVDDEPNVLRLHARMVKMWAPEYHVLTAQNGWEALEIIRQQQPDLILLDLIMPGLDGFKVLEHMRSDTTSQDIPVIVLTGRVLTQEDMAQLNTGVVSVLQKKVFSVDETLAHVEAALNRSKNLGDEARRLVRKAMAYIHEHYTEAVSLESAAHYIGVSKEYLARCFRQEMGMTLITYLNRYRVAQAKTLLKEKEKRVLDVALQVGFSSSAYFSRVFQQEVGKSPQEYQQIC